MFGVGESGMKIPILMLAMIGAILLYAIPTKADQATESGDARHNAAKLKLRPNGDVVVAVGHKSALTEFRPPVLRAVGLDEVETPGSEHFAYLIFDTNAAAEGRDRRMQAISDLCSYFGTNASLHDEARLPPMGELIFPTYPRSKDIRTVSDIFRQYRLRTGHHLIEMLNSLFDDEEKLSHGHLYLVFTDVPLLSIMREKRIPSSVKKTANVLVFDITFATSRRIQATVYAIWKAFYLRNPWEPGLIQKFISPGIRITDFLDRFYDSGPAVGGPAASAEECRVQ